MIKTLLIANRGEIVLRVARTCREMGIRTIGVYSDADERAAHVRAVDEAWHIGGASPSESYLRQDRILEVAKASGADAIHPGYGFLSENAGFARAVEAAGLAWVGPPADVIELMGDKLAARQTAKKLDVPLIPGTTEPLEDPSALTALAEELGFPVLLKASGGGGGKGIRLVHSPERLAKELSMAQNEARKAFGNPAVYMEKAIINGRHIEVQVLASAGRTIHLGERECSLQRRHQKLVEEAPSPIITPELRDKLTSAAVALTSGIGYRNAGTIEFLVDDDHNVYFLEMNTRLQVEHAITEMVTGVDLVRQQLLIASGLEMEYEQSDIEIRGHSFEFRVYAEDPWNGFKPALGRVSHLVMPSGPFVRCDSSLFEGDEVSLHYDPMLAKLVVWHKDRETALARLVRAAEDFLITGPRTSLPLIPLLAANEDFQTGRFHTKWLEAFMETISGPSEDDELLAAVAAALAEHAKAPAPVESGGGGKVEAWKMSGRPGFPRRF